MFGSDEKTPLVISTGRRQTSPRYEDSNSLTVPDLTKRRSRSHLDEGRKDVRGNFGSSSRMRTNSVAVFHDLDDSIRSTVSTSYGPVVVIDNAFPGYGGAIGLILATVSGILFTLNNFLFQYFNLNLTDMLLARSALQTAVLGLVLLFTGCSTFIAKSCCDWFLVVAQSLTSGARVGLTFACLEFLPIGDALTIIFSEPLWTLLLSKIFLKTRVGWWKLTFSLVLITGVVLCTQPPVIFSTPSNHHQHNRHQSREEFVVQKELHQASGWDTKADFVMGIKTVDAGKYGISDDVLEENIIDDFYRQNNETNFKQKNATDIIANNITSNDDADNNGYYIGVLLALGAAMSGSAQNVIVAKLDQISSTSLCTYGGLGGIILALAYGIFVDTEDMIIPSILSVTAEEWLTLIILGAMGLVGFFALTRSLQLIPPTTVAVVRAMEIVLAYGIQAAVLGEVPNALAVVGSSLVIFSVVTFAAEDMFLPYLTRMFQ